MTIAYDDDMDVSVEESLGIFLAWQNLGPVGNGKNKWHDPQGAPGHRYRYQKSEPGSRKSKAKQPSLPLGGQPEPVEPKAPKPPTKAQIRAQEVAARKEQRLKVKEEKAAAKAKAQQDRLSARQAKVDAKAASAKELAELPAKTRQYVQDLLAGKHGPIAPEHVQAVADMVSKMKQSDVNALKKEVALRVGGKKVEQAKAIAAKALKMAEKASPSVSDVRAAADAFRKVDVEGLIEQISALPDEQILQAARQAGIDTSGGKARVVANLAKTLGGLREAAGGKKMAGEIPADLDDKDPFVGKDRKSQFQVLSNAISRADAGESDPLGLREPPSTPVDMRKFGSAVGRTVAAHQLKTTVGIPIDKLYESVGRDLGLSKRDFLKALVAEHLGEGKMRLSGWSRMLTDLPDPELAPMISSKVMGYVHMANNSTDSLKQFASREPTAGQPKGAVASSSQPEPVDEPSEKIDLAKLAGHQSSEAPKKAAVPAMSNKALRDKAWKAMEAGEYAKNEGYGIDGSIAADVIGLIDKMEEGSPLDVEADILRMLERSSPGEIPDPASHAAINALGRKALDSLDDAGVQQALRGIPAYNPRTKTYRAVLDKNLPGLAGWLRDKFGASPEKSTTNQPEPVDPRPSPRRLPPPSIDDADAVSSVHKAIRDATRSGKPEVAARVRSAYEAAQGDRAKMAKLKEGLAGLVSRASPAGQPEPVEENGSAAESAKTPDEDTDGTTPPNVLDAMEYRSIIERRIQNKGMRPTDGLIEQEAKKYQLPDGRTYWDVIQSGKSPEATEKSAAEKIEDFYRGDRQKTARHELADKARKIKAQKETVTIKGLNEPATGYRVGSFFVFKNPGGSTTGWNITHLASGLKAVRADSLGEGKVIASALGGKGAWDFEDSKKASEDTMNHGAAVVNMVKRGDWAGLNDMVGGAPTPPAGQPEPAEANGEDEYSLDSRIRSGSFDAATADEANDYLDANARSMKISDLKKLASSWGLHSAHGSKGEIIRQIKNYISKIAVLNGQTDF